MNNFGYKVTILAHSIGEAGIPLVTFLLRYPRFIHAELLTHKDFSRSSSSSRAIPIEKMIAMVRDEPATPVYWGANQKGMQADQELNPAQKYKAIATWMEAAESAAEYSQRLAETGVHKQIANRITEPFQFMNVVLTSSRWNNFFALRDHEAAQPEFRYLARLMKDELDKSTPRFLNSHEWHLPFIDDDDWAMVGEYLAGKSTNGMFGGDVRTQALFLRRISAARCARASYISNVTGKKALLDEDLALFDRLINVQPVHASPTEHQAMPDILRDGKFVSPKLHGNLYGWVQYRKLIPNEYVH